MVEDLNKEKRKKRRYNRTAPLVDTLDMRVRTDVTFFNTFKSKVKEDLNITYGCFIKEMMEAFIENRLTIVKRKTPTKRKGGIYVNK